MDEGVIDRLLAAEESTVEAAFAGDGPGGGNGRGAQAMGEAAAVTAGAGTNGGGAAHGGAEVTDSEAHEASRDLAAIGDDERADPYLKSMLLSLIEESYLHSGTFTQFAAEVLKVLAYAVTVPVAFTEGFLRAYLSIERIEETDEGRIKIIPKADASEEDWIRDVDEITAQVDPSAVFNPIVRSKLEAVHDASSKVMKYDIDQLTHMSDGQLMDVLRQMQKESEELEDEGPEEATSESEATDYVRAKLATIRRNVRQFQAQARRAEEAVERGLNESRDNDD